VRDSGWIFERYLYQVGNQRRWIQDSPVLPNVWKAFIDHPGERVDLLITPHRQFRPAQLAGGIRTALSSQSEALVQPGKAGSDANIAHNQSVVAARVGFDELIRDLVPLSTWYAKVIAPHVADLRNYDRLNKRDVRWTRLLRELENPPERPVELSPIMNWWLRLTGYLSIHQEKRAREPGGAAIWKRALSLIGERNADPGSPQLVRISVNRAAETACADSVRTIKADAAVNVFDIDTTRICWAVLDTGIDARHPAFDDKQGRKRVKQTYDFTRIRRLIALASTPGDDAEAELKEEFGITADLARRIRTSLLHGGDVDWEQLKPALQVEHSPTKLDEYASGLNPHGTHVAGIIGGKGQKAADGDSDFIGVCPDIQLIDIRILDTQGTSGAKRGQPEFDIIAALQFVGHMNSASDEPVVHGVNLSIQLLHDPENFACGRTPVCEECNRLVANGVVVVAAAGNKGIDSSAADANTTQGAFRGISIADPGNADAVITVGSTHRKRPHAYGVSFFSSRGPTGDGRLKPDLVAPGEKILGPVPGGNYAEMQGTSQAAPHVSGAAAMLLARHSELIGDPARVKHILCSTATDLGRERYFQGAGLVDILRALQSI
jgi:hypothetical protein